MLVGSSHVHGGDPAATLQPPEPSQQLLSALEASWTGVYDDLEQVVFDAGPGSGLLLPTDQRVRTIVTPVGLPWLGAHVLYLEEFLHDEPGSVRRQLLLVLQPATAGSDTLVRVRQFSFRHPSRWHLSSGDTTGLAELTEQDLQSLPGCDLLLAREGQQFHGGTLGRRCAQPGAAQYIDYRVRLGEGLYWYRKRLLRSSDDELVSETIGYEWFELHQTRLFACRVRWSGDATAAAAPLAVLELHDQGGRARFDTPDGRSFEIELHSRDWPFDLNHDALLLVLREHDGQGTLVSSWSALDADQIDLELAPLAVRCGPLAPQRDTVS
jgi:CpeT/CpcT family (DUF1001)